MAIKQSAGILLYRKNLDEAEIFLVHPGGPFWKNKEAAAWSIPKGEFMEGEEALSAATREFYEETGSKLSGDFIGLNPVRLKSGKKFFAWALQADLDETTVKSNLFEMEWPPHSGKYQYFPEVDKGAWFQLAVAKEKISRGQLKFITQLEEILGDNQ